MCGTRPAVDGRLRPRVCLADHSGFAGSMVLRRLNDAEGARPISFAIGYGVRFWAFAAKVCPHSHTAGRGDPPATLPESVRVPIAMADCGRRFLVGERQSVPASAAGFTPIKRCRWSSHTFSRRVAGQLTLPNCSSVAPRLPGADILVVVPVPGGRGATEARSPRKLLSRDEASPVPVDVKETHCPEESPLYVTS